VSGFDPDAHRAEKRRGDRVSGTGLDYDTSRRIREFIRRNAGVRLLTAQQVVVHFRLRPDEEADVRELMTETAVPGPLPPPAPDVLTPPAEVLDLLVFVLAVAGPDYRSCLESCQRCRNHLLYLLDTAPYTDCPGEQIRVRVTALPEVHAAHGTDGPDQDPPRIRWISP
jgi:hypothetical protein